MNANVWKRSTRCSTGACVTVLYRRSSHCESGACIEVGQSADAVLVRDSKDPNSPVLTFDTEAWKAFIADVKWGGW